MRLPSDLSSVPGILKFTAFLCQHLSTIDPKLIVFIFNNETAHHANHIAIALTGHVQLDFNSDIKKIKKVEPDWDLLIHFVNEDTKKLANFETKTREFILKMESPPNQHYNIIPKNHNQIVVEMYNGHISKILGQNSIQLSKENLGQSFDWLAFVHSVRYLPNDYCLYVVDDIYDQPNGVADNLLNPRNLDEHSRIVFVSGFKVGIYKILAGVLSGNSLAFSSLRDFASITIAQRPIERFNDKRLSWRYWSSADGFGFYVSTSMTLRYQIYTHFKTKRYVILVPRIVISGNQQFVDNSIRKFLVVAGLLVVTLVFVGFRFCCNWARTGIRPSDCFLVHSFFDTLARSLGISPGAWLGRSSSERQLLTVLGIFAFISSSIFSGVLYEEQFIVHNLKFKYNNLDEACRDRLELELPRHLYTYFPKKYDGKTADT